MNPFRNLPLDGSTSDFHLTITREAIDRMELAQETFGERTQEASIALRNAIRWLRCARLNLRQAEHAMRAETEPLKPLRLQRACQGPAGGAQ